MFILEKLLDIVVPESCLACGSEGAILCSWCVSDACLPLPSRCVSCQAQTQNFATCSKCKHKTILKHVWVATEYTDMAKKLVQALKFGYKRSAALTIADYMSETCEYIPNDMIIMPVPTATSRIRQRGFDHARLIARHLARQHNRSIATNLKRLGQSRQVGAKRELRLKQLNNAFMVIRAQELQGKSIILIDDVTTTGSTLEAAARTLKRAGAKSVSAVIFAQTR